MTTSLVIDAGFAYRLILPGDHREAFREKMTAWQQAGIELYAPSLWVYKLTSAFSKAVHFGALTQPQGHEALQLAMLLGVRLVVPDEDMTHRAWLWTQTLKRAAAYDSFYLALAQTMDTQFWTTDKRLYNAADKPWVQLMA